MKKRPPSQKQVLALIKSVRESFPDATIIYKFGACYGLFGILKSVFTQAAPFENADRNHIVTDIDGILYDIKGEVQVSRSNEEEWFRLTAKDKEYWECVATSQRVEFMLAKYRGTCKND